MGKKSKRRDATKYVCDLKKKRHTPAVMLNFVIHMYEENSEESNKGTEMCKLAE
jgi:hypothetical protein